MKFHLFALALFFVSGSSLLAADRPNIVWIVSEDNSIHYLNHFFDGGAKAPHIEALAAEGFTFENAFSNAPVCSVARTTLATGCYGPRIGTQFHRRYAMAPMPRGLKMFPAYMRDAGYFTTNDRKKDYNAIEGNGVWDSSAGGCSWRDRKDTSQPFFHMQSHGESHEGSLHFSQRVMDNEKTETDPASVKLADYFPDTPTFRYTHARYHDRMMVIDKIVGRTVAKLKEDNLLDDTFIFYFGDHGGVLPRGKGYIYESGLHVPLIVRVPKNFQHLVDGQAGTRVKGFVEFVDFGATTLKLAGISPPKNIDGKPFLGKGISMAEVNSRDETFGYADRFDEKYDLIRSIRKGRYQYIRNFQPYLPDGLNNNYRYKMLAFVQWRDLWKTGKLTGAAKQFFQPRATEMLFDCEADPHQVKNLAADPQYAKTLTDLRSRLQSRLKGMPDLSLYPESHLAANAMDNPTAFGQSNQEHVASMLDTADLALLPWSEAKPKLKQALASDDAMIRYWAAMASTAKACTDNGNDAKSLIDSVKPLLSDQSEVVQVRAAEFLGLVGAINPQTKLTEVVNTTTSPVVATEALNSVVWFHDFFDDRYPVKRSDFHPVSKGGDIDDRLNYINGVPYPPKAKKNQGKKKKNAA